MRFIKNFIVFLILFLLFFHHPISAADFSTDLLSTFTVTSLDTVNVNQMFSITNLSDTRYPTAYELIIPTNKIKNLKITNALNQLIKPETSVSGSNTKVLLHFPKPVVGKGKVQSYTLEYQNQDMLVGSNKILQLAVPVMTLPHEEATATIKVVMPTDICPHPYTSVTN